MKCHSTFNALQKLSNLKYDYYYDYVSEVNKGPPNKHVTL